MYINNWKRLMVYLLDLDIFDIVNICYVYFKNILPNVNLVIYFNILFSICMNFFVSNKNEMQLILFCLHKNDIIVDTQ